MHTCPVCGYNKLFYPPLDESICPSCYTEFGYDDATRSHPELRREWLANGPKWAGANVMPPPYGWNPYEQLKNIGAVEEPENYSAKESHTEVVDLGALTTRASVGNNTITIQGHLYAVGRSVASVIAQTITARETAHA